MNRFRFALLRIVIISLPFILLGCGGGGGSGNGSGSGVGSEPPSSMGTAAVFIKDAPTEEYESIVLCISKATLEPGSIRLFESDSCVEVDLLDHQERPFLLTVKDIPAGTYDQIRLRVDDIYTKGGVCDTETIKIPSGTVKVNPQGPIEIKSGEKIGVTIDIHAKRSVNLHPAGKSGKCIFRPVIISEIEKLSHIPSKEKCPRILSGTVLSIEDASGQVKGFRLRLAHDTDSKIDIRVDENTAIFDENGDFTTPDALEVGQKVKVRGEIQKDAAVRASVIAIGELLNLRGTALTRARPDIFGDLTFEMRLDPFQAIVDNSIDVIVEHQTLILMDCTTEVDDDAIKPGVGVRAVGKLSEGDLIAFVMFIEERQDYGTIIAMTGIGRDYNVEFIPSGESEPVTLFLPFLADVKLENDGGIQKDLLADLVNCEPKKAKITLNALNEDDSAVADLIEVQDKVIEGTIKRTDPDARTLTIKDETVIQVQDLATILRNGSELIHFNQLKENDEITVFGLEACPGDNVDFHGFVIVVSDDDGRDDRDDD
jgi:hypothetical protein